jgi:hypothetical protein
VSVVVHGPAGLVAKVPLGELARSVTVSAGPLETGVPAVVVSVTVEAADGVPAVTLWVVGAIASSGWVQARNDCQAAL